MAPLSFVLSSLNQSTQCVDGVTLSKFTDSLTYDATGVFYVNIQDMKNVFGYQTDGIDMNNLAEHDIKYYVDMTKWPANLTLNPSHAMMFNAQSTGGFDISDVLIPDAKKLVKHDYIRYLANKLFNTTRAVDLMANELELNENLSGNGSLFTSMNSRNILDILNSISTTSTDAYSSDANGKKYLTNATLIPTNIVRSIMEQINNTEPERFNNLSPDEANDLIRSVPFMVGDRLNFTLKIKAAANQHNLTKVQPIPDRTYLISLVLANGDAAALNLQVTDSAFIGDLPYSVFYPNVLKHAPDIFADCAQATKIPSGLGYFNNGWYYKNNTTADVSAPGVTPSYNLRKINWYMPPSTGAKVSDLKYIYMTGQILSNKSLPFITLYTKPFSTIPAGAPPNGASWYRSRRTYESLGGVSVVTPGTVAHQLVARIDNNESYPVVDGYKQIMLTNMTTSLNRGPFENDEEILFYSIGTNSAATNSGDCEFILNTFCTRDNGASKIPVYYFEQL
jgi:hypothetical protein